MSTQPGALTGWLGSSGVNPNMFAAPPGTPPPISGPTSAPAQGQSGQVNPATLGNPGGYSNPQGANEVQRNQGIANIEQTQLQNQLIPQFAQQLFGLTQGPSQFFNQLMNLGSPYYQQQQYSSFNQGNQQANNAAAQARQQLQAQGLGYTPSGAEAAMMGGMGQQAAGNLSMQFLQNLFNNEQMQLAGAQGQAGLAQMFEPGSLLGTTATNISQPSTFFQNLSSTLGSIFGQGGAGATAKGIAGAV